MLNVLVADDNPITLDFLAAALCQLGGQCSVAPNGISAVTLAASERFDLLLLDARMPGLNGADALARIRAGAGLSCSAPALATTAGTDRDDYAALLAEGFDAVLPKPISLAELSAALRGYGPDRGARESAVFDDERALSVVGGNAQIVRALRGLLLSELERLPGELSLMSHQLDALDELDQRLHRLQASAGFCGVVALEKAVVELQAAQQVQSSWPVAAVHQFLAECQYIAGQVKSVNAP